MHFQDRRPDQTEERILPLINVVFLLLIFFMIAGSLAVTEPFDINPPASLSDKDHEPDSLMILVSKDSQFALDNQPIDEAQLLGNIAKVLQDKPDTPITLKVDSGLPANQLVRFTQLLYAAGVKKLQLLTLQEDA